MAVASKAIRSAFGPRFRKLADARFNQSDPLKLMVARGDAGGRLFSEAIDAGVFAWSQSLPEMREQAAQSDNPYFTFWILVRQDWLRCVNKHHNNRAGTNSPADADQFFDDCHVIANAIEADAEQGQDAAERVVVRARAARRAGHSRKPTSKQVQAMQLYAEFKGDKTKAAKQMGVARATFDQHYQSGCKNMGLTANVLKPSTKPLGTDRRGQVSDSEDRRR